MTFELFGASVGSSSAATITFRVGGGAGGCPTVGSCACPVPVHNTNATNAKLHRMHILRSLVGLLRVFISVPRMDVQCSESCRPSESTAMYEGV
jgi:hypothetical protein